ncbi:FAD-dependent monooxygenase [Streptomyces canus]|uniref:FAD-dependent monooxygenase n=1 Tax=Streptomyces canus TaxID=58343 RepID=UPI003819F93C
MDADVIVVGAGPAGLMLAAELRLHGVRPLVVERLAEPSEEPRARGIGPLAAEALRRRGLGEPLRAHQPRGLSDRRRDHGSEKGHFAWIHKIDQEVQEEPDRAGALIWQPDLERVLADHAAALGVRTHREHVVTGVDQSADRVTVTCRTPGGVRRLAAPYVIGCDGGRSAVRKLTGFAFPGTEPLMVARRARADVVCPAGLPPVGRTPTGTLFHAPGMVGTFDFEDVRTDTRAPVTARELEASLRRVAGAEVEVTAVHQAMRFTDQARLVPSYRRGRVLLAGDSAHVHSPNGGQGLTLGLLDAANLGWKLAATLRGTAPEGLLDSYTAERRPVAEATLHNTRAQSALMRPGPHTDALRDIVSDLMDIPEVNRYFGRLLSGLDTRYALPHAGPDAHRLTGTHCPDMTLKPAEPPGTAATTLARLAEQGRPVLVHTGRPEVERAARPWHATLCAARVAAIEYDDLSALLMRPDGVIAWAAGTAGAPDADGLERALRTWFVPSRP